MAFKLDAMERVQVIVGEINRDHPELFFFGDEDPVGYYSLFVKLVKERMTEYEIDVMIDMYAHDERINGRSYELAKMIFEMLFKFDMQPSYVMGVMDALGGNRSQRHECPGDE